MNFHLRNRFNPSMFQFALPIVVLTAAMLLAACSSNESAATPTFTPVPQVSTQASLEETISLSPGQSAEITGENLEFAFHRVFSDSRCPTGTQCVMDGTALVVMQLVGQDIESGRIETLISPGGTADILIGDYTLHLLTLEPDPPSANGVDASDYQITFNVSKN
jgi:hypothetical protein